jgi:hypothetical protein
MRSLLSERNIVVILFVMVLITFSLAQEDSRKMERLQIIQSNTDAAQILTPKPENKITRTSGIFYIAAPGK